MSPLSKQGQAKKQVARVAAPKKVAPKKKVVAKKPVKRTPKKAAPEQAVAPSPALGVSNNTPIQEPIPPKSPAL